MPKMDILTLVLQAEREYQSSMKSAVKDTEHYVDEGKMKQDAYFEELKRDWYLFAKGESQKYVEMLAEDEKRMEAEIAKSKEWYRKCQKEKADAISERLKEEVLSLIWQ